MSDIDLLQWVKANAKDDANVAEFEEAYSRLTDVERILDRKEVRSEIDRRISDVVAKHDEKFKAEKLPELIKAEREKIMAEANPAETPEQKRIRELEEKLSRADKERQAQERRQAIRRKAQELKLDGIGLTPDDVEPFAVFGDEAESVLESFASKFSKQFETAVDAQVKSRFGDAPPKAKEEPEAEAFDFEGRMSQTFLGQ